MKFTINIVIRKTGCITGDKIQVCHADIPGLITQLKTFRLLTGEN